MLCQSLALTLHLLTYHDQPGYDGHNYGAGLECDTGPVIVAAGNYHNSVRRDSNYLIVGRDLHYGFAHVGAFAGVVSGYPWAPLIAGLRTGVTFKGVSLDGYVFPPAGPSPFAVHAAVSVKLW